jgi:amidase
LLGTLHRHLDVDTVLCLPSAWTIAPLKTAPAGELAANRVKDLTLGSVASLSGAPQVSIPIVSDTYAIGLSFLGAPGEDARLLALAERLTA